MAGENTLRPVLEGMISRLEPGLPGSALGEILNRLIWLTDDNGSDLIAVCQEWLDSDDLRRVEAALSVEEGWIYEDRPTLERKLAAAGKRWPQLGPRIKAILDSYDREFKK